MSKKTGRVYVLPSKEGISNPEHIELLSSLAPNVEKLNDSKYWTERAIKALAITTQDRETHPCVDHTRGQGPWLYDLEGNKYLDTTSGVAVRALGFRYPPQLEFEKKTLHVARELPGQDFDSVPHTILAEKLASISPGDHEKRVLFTTSGARAIEGAMKSAMDKTGNSRFVAFRPAFHGRTGYALALTASNHLHKNKFPQGVDVIRVPYPYCYRCPYNQIPDDCDLECAFALRDALEYEGTDIAAIFFEPIVGEGGLIVPPKKFVKELRRITDDYQTYLVSDEIQAGMGRTGKWWAIENFGVSPDYIATGKALGAGYALGGTIGPAPMFSRGSRHSQTVSAEPFQALVSLFQIREIEKKNILENVKKMGEYLLKRLHELKENIEVVGDVRGLGLMIGLEIVKEKKSKERAPKLRDKIVQKAVKQQKLWTLGAGRNSIRLLPYYLITDEQADMTIDRLEGALKA